MSQTKETEPTTEPTKSPVEILIGFFVSYWIFVQPHWFRNKYPLNSDVPKYIQWGIICLLAMCYPFGIHTPNIPKVALHPLNNEFGEHWYTAFTHTLFHSNLQHLIMNCSIFATFGDLALQKLGFLQFVLVWLSAGLITVPIWHLDPQVGKTAGRWIVGASVPINAVYAASGLGYGRWSLINTVANLCLALLNTDQGLEKPFHYGHLGGLIWGSILRNLNLVSSYKPVPLSEWYHYLVQNPLQIFGLDALKTITLTFLIVSGIAYTLIFPLNAFKIIDV